jgi:cystathionine beta-synthase
VVLRHLVSGRATPATSVAEIMDRKTTRLSPGSSAGELTAIFERGEVAVVVDETGAVLGLLTKMDLIEILASRRRGASQGN